MFQKKYKFFVFEKRDKVSRDAIESIITSQMPRVQKLKFANDVIENTGSIEKLKLSVDCLHENYLILAERS